MLKRAFKRFVSGFVNFVKETAPTWIVAISMVGGFFILLIGNRCVRFVVFFVAMVVLSVIANLLVIRAGFSEVYRNFPKTNGRFTKREKQSGMVTVDRERLQDLILFVAEVEDWAEYNLLDTDESKNKSK